MSSDERFLERLILRLSEVRLDAIVVGMMAAVLQGAPTTTRDVDLLVRDTKRNRQKLDQLRQKLGRLQVVASDIAPIETLVGAEIPIDVIYDHLPGGLTFASIRSRSVLVTIGAATARVASLEDVIRSKEAAGRPKDIAELPILRETARVLEELKKLR